MLRALRTAALGMTAQQTGVDNIANNLANANTTAFKRQTIVFQDLLYETVQASSDSEATGGARPGSLQIGHGATAVTTVRSFGQGGLTQTGNPLDLGIRGEGFLQVRKPDGSIAYTRDGTLSLDAEGNIVTQNGLMVEPGLAIPPESAEVHISGDGLLSVRIPGEPELVNVGQLELARFANPAGLQPVGSNLFEQTDSSGEPTIGTPGQDGIGDLLQGFLESSNVDVVQEMVNLITAQRAYEINSKMVTAGDEMLQTANGIKR
ncbi:MAG: flagellar basal-body rod protein FlgG [Bacteroidetes bacterium]|nr:flagellar basal-body rod protein FlgG [Bacteroidota bacterium]